jgi:hypothetical protein
MSEETKAFNARYLSSLTPDRVYRVYLSRDETFFIRISGQPWSQAVAPAFGALGSLILEPMQRRAAAKLRERCSELDAQDPGLLLKAHKHNFRAAMSDFEQSSLDPAGGFADHGPHYGRWVFKLRREKPMILQLDTLSDMQKAHQMLGDALGPVHQINVEWSSSKNQFVKRAS